MNTVLIAGGSGLVGGALIQSLKGWNIRVLSTRKNAKVTGAEVYYWNPDQYEMDESALEDVSCIINLAGANINHKWTIQYKQEIVDSRTRTAETLFKHVRKLKSTKPECYISASGVNYYPNSLDAVFTEDDENGKGFLAQVCNLWEQGADKFETVGLRVVKLRTGMVLSRNGGAMKMLEPLAKFCLNAPIGNGKQWISWIHIADLVGIIKSAMTNETYSGVYNAVAPQPVTNKEMAYDLAKAVIRPVLIPFVPRAAVKLLFGQMSTVVLEGQNASAQKLENAGYQFQFKTMPEALKDLFN